MYGLEILEKLTHLDLPSKEGTLYPLLSRLTEDGYLKATWETQNLKGHPRKFYSLTPKGASALAEMESEFERMIDIIQTLKDLKIKQEGSSNE